MSLAVRKWFLRLLSFDYNRTSNVHAFVHVNVGAKIHILKLPLILDKLNIMIVMQKFNLIAIILRCKQTDY